jgi:hypothetical protein
MSKNRSKRSKQEEHKKDLQKKQALKRELEKIIDSADNTQQEKIKKILADEELIDLRPEGLVTKSKGGKTRVHFWR